MKKKIKNHIKIITLLIIVFIILYFLHITLGDMFESQYGHTEFDSEPTIIFQEDHINNILTVTEIYPKDRDWHWPEISIVNGSATLPYGIIEVGDKITNCDGYLKLEWGEPGIQIWEADFR